MLLKKQVEKSHFPAKKERIDAENYFDCDAHQGTKRMKESPLYPFV